MFIPVTLQLLEGFVESVKIFLLTLAFALPLGGIVALGSMSAFRPLRLLTRGFVWIIRGSPLMLQLLIIFYGPGLLFGLGMRNESKNTIYPAHTKDWDIDEDALQTGVAVFVQFVLDNMGGIDGMVIPEKEG